MDKIIHQCKTFLSMSENNLESRLRKIMDHLGLSQAEMARKMGIAATSLGKYLADESVKGKRNPEMLATKLSTLGISLDWYFSGIGEMMRDQSPVLMSPSDRHALEVGRDFIAVMKKAGEGTFKLENDSTADCRLPTAAPETVSDEPFTLPTPPARQQAGPPPSIEAFERSQEGMRSPIRRS